MEEILRKGLAEMGIQASPETIAQLVRYGKLLMEKNAVMNLTAIRDEEGIARLHFLDSAGLLGITSFSGKRVLDVGSGAGFPGMPLRILCPDMSLTVIDSVGKKMAFVQSVCDDLGFADVNCISGRVEEQPEFRESFDLVVSRAVSELNILAELCLPQVVPGGWFIAMKGPECREETERAAFAIREMGGHVEEIRTYSIPGTDVAHAAVMVKKDSSTPSKYPRRYAQMKKKPL